MNSFKLNSYEISRKKTNEIDHYSIKNVKIVNKDYQEGPSLFLPGNSFIIYGLESSYFHVMLDNLAQFLVLRKLFNNKLSLYIVIPASTEQVLRAENVHGNKLVYNLTQIFLKEAGIDSSILYIKDYSSIYADELSFIDVERLTFLNEIFKDLSIEKNILFLKNYFSLYISELRELFKQYYSSNLPHKKIFVSRKKISLDIRNKIQRIYDMQDSGYLTIGKSEIIAGKGFDSSLEIQPDGFYTSEILEAISSGYQNLLTRHISEEDEEKIESFFKHNGYDIVDMSELSFYQQIWMLSETSHFASLSGSGLLNSIFLPDNCNIFVLNNNTEYAFPHNKYIDYRFANARYIHNAKKDDPGPMTYSADQIISYIVENYLGEL